MLTYEDALRIALAQLQKDEGLVESATRELPYVEPEEAHGVVWRVPQRYRASRLETLLQALPYTFAGHDFYFRLEVFEELDAAGCCTYELREHRRGPPS
jgi:hypothetical protein